MRQWNIDPKLLCRKHLLGEHVECHMLVGAINKGKRINGFIKKGLIQVHTTRKQHDKLATEMERRGYKHKSPLPEFESFRAGKVDQKKSIRDLGNRCSECRKNILTKLKRRRINGKVNVE